MGGRLGTHNLRTREKVLPLSQAVRKMVLAPHGVT